jgi:hypothetical protein
VIGWTKTDKEQVELEQLLLAFGMEDQDQDQGLDVERQALE